MKVVHGTTKAGYNAIINRTGKESGPWYCSDRDGCTYVYPFDKVEKEWVTEDEEETEQRALQMAFESAQIQTVHNTETTLVAIVIEVPDNLLDDDFSCENMDSIASCFNIADWDKVTILNVYECETNIYHKPFVLAGLIGMEQFNDEGIEPALYKTAKIIADSQVFIEEILEFDYKKVS